MKIKAINAASLAYLALLLKKKGYFDTFFILRSSEIVSKLSRNFFFLNLCDSEHRKNVEAWSTVVDLN